MKRTVDNPDFDFAGIETLFKRVLNLLEPLSHKVFRGANNSFSTSYYDAITIGIASNIDYYENISTIRINDKINELINNNDFIKNMGAGSSTKNRVINRIRTSLNIFNIE